MSKNKYIPWTNTKLLAQRNCAICKNRFCKNVTEMPIDTEFCPGCNKRMSKTIAVNSDHFGQTNQFELTGE